MEREQAQAIVDAADAVRRVHVLGRGARNLDDSVMHLDAAIDGSWPDRSGPFEDVIRHQKMAVAFDTIDAYLRNVDAALDEITRLAKEGAR